MWPLRRPARTLVAVAILAVVGIGQTVRFQDPARSSISARIALGPDSTAVLEVEPRGDAARAGLQTSDQVLAIDGQRLSTRRAVLLSRAEQSFWSARGDLVRIRVDRGGDDLEVES